MVHLSRVAVRNLDVISRKNHVRFYIQNYSLLIQMLRKLARDHQDLVTVHSLLEQALLSF